MYKFLTMAIFSFVLLLLVPTSASASDGSDNTLRHAYKPYQVAGRNTMNARVDNFDNQPVKRLVCVEAFNNASGRKTHLGCLWVDLAAHNSLNQWAAEFEAPTNWLKTGSYRVVYTFQSPNGSWHRIMSVNLTANDGSYVAQ